MHALMTDVLGHGRYAVYGFDWARSSFTSRMRTRMQSSASMSMPFPLDFVPPPQELWTVEELEFAELTARWPRRGSPTSSSRRPGQSRLPDRPPAALGAWIVEKIHAWSDHEGDFEDASPRRFSRRSPLLPARSARQRASMPKAPASVAAATKSAGRARTDGRRGVPEGEQPGAAPLRRGVSTCAAIRMPRRTLRAGGQPEALAGECALFSTRSRNGPLEDLDGEREPRPLVVDPELAQWAFAASIAAPASYRQPLGFGRRRTAARRSTARVPPVRHDLGPSVPSVRAAPSGPPP